MNTLLVAPISYVLCDPGTIPVSVTVATCCSTPPEVSTLSLIFVPTSFLITASLSFSIKSFKSLELPIEIPASAKLTSDVNDPEPANAKSVAV